MPEIFAKPLGRNVAKLENEKIGKLRMQETQKNSCCIVCLSFSLCKLMHIFQVHQLYRDGFELTVFSP